VQKRTGSLVSLLVLALGLVACSSEITTIHPEPNTGQDMSELDMGSDTNTPTDSGGTDQDQPDLNDPDIAAPDLGVEPDMEVDMGAPLRPIGPRPVTPTPVEMGTIFAAPTGSGTECTEQSPCSLTEATNQAMAGDVVFLRGGVYLINGNINFRGRGTTVPTVFESYPGEVAILDGSMFTSDQYVHIRVLGDPVIVRLITIRNMPKEGIAVRSSDHVLEGLTVHSNLLSGIHVHESYDTPSSNRNIIRDCVVYDNSGVGLGGSEFANGGNSDGISISSGIGNRVENCLVYDNSDDGIDVWRSTDSYVGYSIVYGQGLGSGDGQGIKAGGFAPSARSHVEHCISFSNRSAGFDFNSGAMVTFRHNTSWNNGRGFQLGSDTLSEKNLAFDDNAFGGAGTQNDNSWQRPGAPVPLSTDIQDPDFLKPAPNSGFEDLGARAGRE